MSSEVIDSIINELNEFEQLSDIPIEKIVDVESGYSYKIAYFSYSKKYKSGYLRSAFDYVKRIEKSDKEWKYKKVEFYLLKPRLAMGVRKKQLSRDVYNVIITAMNLVDVSDEDAVNLNNFNYFIYFFESIISYHRFLGG